MVVPTEIALFAGAGGGVLASRLLGHRIVCYVEREPYRISVLESRIADELLDDAPVWDDVRTFDGRPWRGLVDIVSGGFPCQPFSGAGLELAGEDERDGWPATVRIIREVRPVVVFLENVARLVTGSHGYFGVVLGDLAASGYDARWDCIPASAVGADHERDRVWIFAVRRDLSDAERERLRLVREWGGEQCCESRAAEPTHDGAQRTLADAGQGRLAIVGAAHDDHREEPPRHDFAGRGPAREMADSEGEPVGPRLRAGGPRGLGWRRPRDGGCSFGSWPAEPDVGRVAYGLASGLDRLAALGDGQVPRVAVAAFRALGGDLT